jgi:hypothetical protein
MGKVKRSTHDSKRDNFVQNKSTRLQTKRSREGLKTTGYADLEVIISAGYTRLLKNSGITKSVTIRQTHIYSSSFE